MMGTRPGNTYVARDQVACDTWNRLWSVTGPART